MKVGTKSLLFGIHQVFIHPYVVYKAWKFLYGRPTWREFVCIVIHDWGYWGRRDLDGSDGITHPSLGANIAYKLYGQEYWKLCAGHSRGYIKYINADTSEKNITISKLCWADKLSFCFEHRWFYLFRARLSGELKLVREESARQGIAMDVISNKALYSVISCAIRNIPEIKELILKKTHNYTEVYVVYYNSRRCEIAKIFNSRIEAENFSKLGHGEFMEHIGTYIID